MDINLEKITARRRDIIAKAIKHNVFNLDTFANFFEVKRKLIEEDLKALGYDDVNADKSISLDKLRDKRDEIISQCKENNMSDGEILEKIGMWHLPINLKQTESLFFDMVPLANPKPTEKSLMDAIMDYQLTPNEMTKTELINAAEEYVPNFNEALTMAQLGSNKTDLAEKFNWSGATLIKFSKIAKQLGVSKTPDYQLLSHPEIRKSLDIICKENKKRSMIAQHTGVVSGLINDIKNFGAEEIYQREQNKLPSQKQQNIEERRQKVWELYNQFGSTHGFKEEEIATMLGITRVTVSADLRAYKDKNPEAIDETQLYRGRHNGIEKYMAREKRKKDVLYIYDKVYQKHPDASNYIITKAISEVTEISPQMVYNYLIEEGRMTPYQFRETHLDKEVNHEALIGWQNKGQFGQGSTRALLDEKNIEKGSVEERNVRNDILYNQRATMAYLRNNKDIATDFNTDGNLERVFKATKETEENTNIENQEEEELELA